MFGLFKKKLQKLVDNLSGETKEKVELPEEKVPEVETKIEEKTVEEVVKERPRISLFKKISEKVKKTVVEKTLSSEEVSEVLNEFENDLIEADVAVEVAEKIKLDLTNALVGQVVKRGKLKEIVDDALRKSLLEILSVPQINLEELVAKKKPVTLLFLGFNGAGKTTSLAKLAKFLMNNGHSCVFAAADTFRAASVEQLEEHAKRIGVQVIKHRYGADPAAVIYDAIEYAKAHDTDFVLADSAGRAHTNANLMDQMKKIIRVDKPDLKILVIDSLTGNDAVLQAREFGTVGIDAVIFTKIDVNEKGGAILSVTHELKKPILFIGLGQEYENVEKFDAEKFVSNLLVG